MSLDFYPQDNRDEDSDINSIIQRYSEALESNDPSTIFLSENDFESLIEHFISKNDVSNMELCSELGFKMHPYSSRLFVEFCDCLILSGKASEALKLLYDYKDSFESYGPYNVVMARSLIRIENYQEAQEAYNLSIKIIDNNDEKYEFTYSLAVDCIECKSYDNALYYLNNLNSFKKNAFEFYNDCAYCYDKLENTLESIKYYNKYLDIDPFNDYIWFNIGTVYAKEGDYDNAIESFLNSIALNKMNDSSYFNLGAVYLSLSRYREAIDTLKHCLTIDTNSIDSHIGMAEAYIGLDELDNAKESYKLALNLDKENQEAKLSYNCIIAMEEYNRGNIEGFIEIIKSVSMDSYDSVTRLYSIFPHLLNDEKFLEVLVKIKDNNKES